MQSLESKIRECLEKGDIKNSVLSCHDLIESEPDNQYAVMTAAYLYRILGNSSMSQKVIRDHFKDNNSNSSDFPVYLELSKTLYSSSFDFPKILDSLNKTENSISNLDDKEKNQTKIEHFRSMTDSLPTLSQNIMIMNYFYKNLNSNEDELILFQNACFRYVRILDDLGLFSKSTSMNLKPYCQKYLDTFNRMYEQATIYPLYRSHQTIMSIVSHADSVFNDNLVSAKKRN